MSSKKNNSDMGHNHLEYCSICGASVANCICNSIDKQRESKVYLLENLECANCAAKMEKKINELENITNATITFATKQLSISGISLERILPKLQKICSSIEAGVKVIPKEAGVISGNSVKSNGKKTGIVFENKQAIFEIGFGIVLLILGKVIESRSLTISNAMFIVAYIILGRKIVITAAHNLIKGQVFDENFLMSIATLGAFVIQDFSEAVGVMLFYRIGELFEHIAVEKSRSQIMDAVDMRPETVNLEVGKEIQVIPAKEAEVGHILLVRPGDRIPLDGVILEGESRIDTSPITGEPVPIKASVGDKVVSGCLNASGLLKIRVQKTLQDSMVTRILDSVENAAASKPKMDRFITKFARIYTPFVVILATATAIIPSLFTGNWEYWIYTALTFLVISCPCALVLSVPLAFFSGIGAGSKKGILFKGGMALEALKEVKAVVMDKTGTITKGNFVVQHSVPIGAVAKEDILKYAASCELASTHPIGNSIVMDAKEKGISIQPAEKVTELSGKGIQAFLSGEEILCGNQKLMDSFGVDLSSYKHNQYGTEVLVAKNRMLIGYFVISDTIKEDSVKAISSLKKQSIMTAMLTGDAQKSADEIALQTGIDEVHAKLLPQDKLNELKKIRQIHGAVMFVGDGINDAPVLAGADVGAAMGNGADAAIEAADVVFMTSAMEAIPQSIEIARSTSQIAMQNVTVALIIKIIVMILGLLGYANMWMAVLADTGVTMLCILNSIRILYKK